MSLLGMIYLVVALWIIVFFLRLLVRSDRKRRLRPHPLPEEGGASFADTTAWGGSGRPGS